MGMSDRIETFITELLKEENEDWLELRRNELASVFGCVPSQINYVISTRFTPQQGYMVESRRGGGGYLRIKRINTDNAVYKLLQSVENQLDWQTAKSYIEYLTDLQAISSSTAKIMLAAVSDNSIKSGQPSGDEMRADIFKNMLMAIE